MDAWQSLSFQELDSLRVSSSEDHKQSTDGSILETSIQYLCQDEAVEGAVAKLEECMEQLHRQVGELFDKHKLIFKKLLVEHRHALVNTGTQEDPRGDFQVEPKTLRQVAANDVEEPIEVVHLKTKRTSSDSKRTSSDSELSGAHPENFLKLPADGDHGYDRQSSAQSFGQVRTPRFVSAVFSRINDRLTSVTASGTRDFGGKPPRTAKKVMPKSNTQNRLKEVALLGRTKMMRYSQHDRERQRELKAQATMRAPTSDIKNILEEHPTCQSRVKKLVTNHWFDQLCGALLLSNAFWIGIQVEYVATTLSESVPTYYIVIDTLYAVFFAVEIILRLVAVGTWKFFTDHHDRNWNIMDFLIVTSTSFEVAVSLINHDSSGGFWSIISGMRTIRVIRIARMARVIRLMRFFRSLRILIGAILNTMKSCVWTGMLLGMILYMFGVFFAQAVAEHRIKMAEGQQPNPVLLAYYGTLPRAMFTMFKSILGGIDWEVAVQPLSDLDWTCVALFTVMICFVLLAVLNVVSGLFLQSALEQAQSDRDDMIHAQLKDKQEYMRKVHAVFGELDSDGDGTITFDEFEHHLSDDRMKGFLQSLELDFQDAWTLFKLLDADGGGSVDTAEFVEGCFRLKGYAKSVHMAQIMYENKWLMDALTELTEMCHKSFVGVLEEVASIRKGVPVSRSTSSMCNAEKTPKDKAARIPHVRSLKSGELVDAVHRHPMEVHEIEEITD